MTGQWTEAGLVRLMAALLKRVCLSCGAEPDENGNLPCGH